MPATLVLMFLPLLLILVICVFSLFLFLAGSLYVLLTFSEEQDFDFIHIHYCFCFQFHWFLLWSLLTSCLLHAFSLLCSSFLTKMKLRLLVWECSHVYLYIFMRIFILATLMSLIIFSFNIFHWLCYIVPIFPLCSPLLDTPTPSSSPPLSSCPWVIRISSLASPLPYTILNLPLSILYLPFMLLIPCTFYPIHPPPSLW